MSRLRLHRRIAALAIAVVAVAGLALASAAQLSVNGGTLQAGSAVVAACQPAGQAVAVDFTSAFASGEYRATAVHLSNVAPSCDGLQFRLQLVDVAGGSIDLDPATVQTDVTGTVALTGGTFSVTIPSTSAAAVARVALVIYG